VPYVFVIVRYGNFGFVIKFFLVCFFSISVCYIPAGDAEVYRESLLIQQSALASPEEDFEGESEEKNREIGEETEEDLVERLV